MIYRVLSGASLLVAVFRLNASTMTTIITNINQHQLSISEAGWFNWFGACKESLHVMSVCQIQN